MFVSIVSFLKDHQCLVLWGQTLEFYTSYWYYNPGGVKHGFLAFTPTKKLN